MFFNEELLFSNIVSLLLQLNNLEKAVAAAHTFLKKNPTDPYLTKNMNYYKTLFDVEEYLVDHEEQPYEVCSSELHTQYPLKTHLPDSLSSLSRVCS